MTEDTTKTPEAQAPQAQAKPPRKPGPSGLTYVNFFLALVSLVVLAGIILDPGYLVPDGLKGRLEGVVQASARNTLALDAVRGRLDELEKGGNLHELLEAARMDELKGSMRALAARTRDPERAAALDAALKALGETP